jgi:capsid portal protein
MLDEEKEKQGSSSKGVKRVFYFIKTSRGLVPLNELRKAEKRKQQTESKQIKAEKEFITLHNLIPYPFNVQGFLLLLENCSFFDACVRQIAKDVAGQGYTINLRKGIETENDDERKAIEDFLSDPNADEDSLEDIIERLIIDWGCIGWFGLEVSRDEVNKVNGLYHIPAHTFWIHKEEKKYCQLWMNKTIWFKKFGYEADIDAKSGDESKPVSPENLAHELIYYRNYYPRSAFYGAPNALSAVGAIKALISIRDYNLAFFENYGIPAALVTAEGDWGEDESGISNVKLLNDFINSELKGADNAHKTVVLNPPAGGKVTWTPLVVEVKEGHFKLYFKNLRDEILVAYKMPSYRIGITEQGSLGGSTAAESTRIYIDSIVNPLKRVINHIFSEKIIKDGLGIESYEFKLGELDIRDMNAIVTRCQTLFGMGGLSRNELRQEIGKSKLPDTEDGDKYYISTSYVPIGEESALASLSARDAAAEDLKKKVDEILKGMRSKGK